jgi:hypothetical protein
MQNFSGHADFPIGARHLECTDPTRIDHQEGRSRRFMVSVFYPGVQRANAETVTLADLLAPSLAEGLEALAKWHKVPLPPNAASQAKTVRFQAHRDLEPNRSEGPYPILICSSPGEGDRFATASLCLRLARQGFVVFSLDHPHDTKVVVYPDHSISDALLINESHMLMRILDVACLVTKLEELSADAFFVNMLNLQRIGAFGHSRGGATAVASAFRVDQILAGIDMDGYLFGFDYGNLCGLERYPESFRQKVMEREKPILRLLGIPRTAGDLSPFFFEAESKFFGGPFIHFKMPDWAHGDFSCDRISSLLKGEEPKESEVQVNTLAHLTGLFFTHMLTNPRDLQWLEEVRKSHPDYEINAKPFGI